MLGGAVSKRSQLCRSAYLSAQGFDGFCVCGKILLAHLSTETTFISLFNDLFLKINKGQMSMTL